MTDTIPTGSTSGTHVPMSDAEREVDAVAAASLAQRLVDLERTVENNRLIRDAWTLIIFAIAAVALLASVIAVGLAMRAIDESERGREASTRAPALVITTPTTI